MRIAVNTRFLLSDKLEGMGWFVFENFSRIVKAHPEHQFLFLFDRPFDSKFLFAENVEGQQLFPPARHPFLFYWWFEFSVTKALKNWKADLFVSPDNFLSLRTKIPTLLVIHDLAYLQFPDQIRFSHKKYYQYFMPRFSKKATRIATVSTYTKEDIHNQFGIHKSKIDVVYNGSSSRFKPLDESEKATVKQQYADGHDYFLYIGSVHPRKNVARLIQAFERFKQKTKAPLKLLLAGRIAWMTGEIDEILKASEYRDEVVFLDYLDQDVLPLVTGAAFALTYVSLFEGFGIPIIEAMQCDVPVITSNTSSMPEVGGDAALYVEPSNVNSIAEQMETVWKSDTLRTDLIKQGKLQREKYSWEQTAERLWQSMLKTIKD